jgi:hypothetical protein
MMISRGRMVDPLLPARGGCFGGPVAQTELWYDSGGFEPSRRPEGDGRDPLPVEEGGLRLGLSPQVRPGPSFSVARIPLQPQVSTIRGSRSMPAWSPRPARALAAGAEGDDDDFGAIGPRGATKDLGDPARGVLGSCLGLAKSSAVRAALNAPAPGPLSGRFGPDSASPQHDIVCEAPRREPMALPKDPSLASQLSEETGRGHPAPVWR